jgi:hypothetical protein
MNGFKIMQAAAVAVGLSMLTPYASAAPREFCEDYASSGVRQAKDAARHERCRYLFKEGPRWNEDYRAHYDWCRGVDRRAADDERNARSRSLERCLDR